MKKEYSKVDFANRLRELREDHDLTQKEIAEKLQMDRATYTRYEIQSTEPSISTLFLLAEIYKTSIDYLVCRTDNPKPYE